MEFPANEIPGIDVVEEEDISIGLKSKVILYNDDWHSFDEVILQIIKAIKCSTTEATKKVLETHVNGKSIIFIGELKDCLRVSSVLEEIALHTQILT
jgi:ATP-dependent Clp protease adaptor protein ClpS